MLSKLFLCAFILMMVMSPSVSPAAEKVFYYHTDQAGTPLAMTDESGTVVWKADYRPFGEEQSIDPATIEDNQKFIGKTKDIETGLYYFGARYMLDQIGRFMSPDPIGPIDPMTGKINQQVLMNPQRLNPYAYALNNPYSYVDHDGKFAIFLAPLAIPALEALGYSVLVLATFKVTEQAYYNYSDGMYNEGSKEESEPSEKGRSAGKLKPDPTAAGPHSVAKRDPKTDKVDKYETYRPQSNPQNPNPWESEKRYDAKGRAHGDVRTPHVHDSGAPGGVRAPRADEIP